MCSYKAENKSIYFIGTYKKIGLKIRSLKQKKFQISTWQTFKVLTSKSLVCLLSAINDEHDIFAMICNFHISSKISIIPKANYLFL